MDPRFSWNDSRVLFLYLYHVRSERLDHLFCINFFTTVTSQCSRCSFHVICDTFFVFSVRIERSMVRKITTLPVVFESHSVLPTLIIRLFSPPFVSPDSLSSTFSCLRVSSYCECPFFSTHVEDEYGESYLLSRYVRHWFIKLAISGVVCVPHIFFHLCQEMKPKGTVRDWVYFRSPLVYKSSSRRRTKWVGWSRRLIVVLNHSWKRHRHTSRGTHSFPSSQ